MIPMLIHRTVVAAGIAGSLFTAALAQPQDLPQTQMAAAAVVMGQVILAGWSSYSNIHIIDDKTAAVYGDLVGGGFSHYYIMKLDDCRFEALKSDLSTKLAMIDLGMIGDEYQQAQQRHGSRGDIISHYVTIIGSGKGPALCASFANNYRCYNNLTLAPGGIVPTTQESSWRALRAVQFLQKYCPPQQLGF
jgi:hypothetical protein